MGPSKASQRNAVIDLFTENANRLALVGVHLMNFEVITLVTLRLFVNKKSISVLRLMKVLKGGRNQLLRKEKGEVSKRSDVR